MTKAVYFDHAFRTMLPATLAEYVKTYAMQEGITASAVLRKAIAEHRDRRLAEEREARRHAEALHRRIEAEHDRVSGGY